MISTLESISSAECDRADETSPAVTGGYGLRPPARVFVTVCGWCGCWLKGPVTDTALIRIRPSWMAVSDGICPSCKVQALRELEGMNLSPEK